MGKKSIDEVIDDIKAQLDKITDDEFYEHFSGEFEAGAFNPSTHRLEVIRDTTASGFDTRVPSKTAKQRDVAIKIFAMSGGLIGCAFKISILSERCVTDSAFETRLNLTGVTFRKDLIRKVCGSSDVGEFLRRANNALRVSVGYVGSQYSHPIAQFGGCLVMVCSSELERDGLLSFAEIELIACESATCNLSYFHGHEEV